MNEDTEAQNAAIDLFLLIQLFRYRAGAQVYDLWGTQHAFLCDSTYLFYVPRFPFPSSLLGKLCFLPLEAPRSPLDDCLALSAPCPSPYTPSTEAHHSGYVLSTC